MSDESVEVPKEQQNKIESLTVEVKNAAWVFISASFDDRHMYDLIWACEALKHCKVPIANILLFVDYPSPHGFFQPFNLDKQVHALSDLNTVLQKLPQFEFVFFVTSGHGSAKGLENNGVVIQPYQLLEQARKTPGLKRGFVVLGQCYGGIFDGLEASKKPEIGLMGASGLSPSVSSGIPSQNHPFKIKGPQADPEGKIIVDDIHWSANPFLFHFFSWLRNPVDTDGDGKLTLLDAYKYAGSKTNDDVRLMRVFRSLEINTKYTSAKEKLQKHYRKVDTLDDIEVETQFAILQEQADFLYFHQEPWALHVNLIRASTLLS